MSSLSAPKISCAVVGLKQGLETAYVLLNHPAFALKAVCDLDPEPYGWMIGDPAMEKSAQEYAQFGHIKKLMTELRQSPGIPAIEPLADYYALLRRDDIPAIFLFVPDALHEEFAIAALRAGKYVLCTKPMALTVESARVIAAEAKKYPGRYMLGFQYCYSPFAQRVAEQIDSGAIGPVRQLSFHYHRGQFRPIYRQKAVSRGPIVQECCHWFDLFYLWTKKAHFTKVVGFGGNDFLTASQDIEDNGALVIEYENRIRCALLFTYFRPTKNAEFLTVNGDQGQIRGTFDRLVVENAAGERVIEVGSNRRLPGLFHDGYYEMHDEFAAMINDRRESHSNWDAGMENVLLSDAAQKALDRGAIVPRGGA